MDWLLDFLRSICRPIGQWLGIPTMTVGIIGLVAIVVILALIIWACAAHARKKKAAAKADADTDADNATVTVNDAEKEEPVSEEQALQEEENAEIAAEETPATEETAAEQPVEEKKEVTAAPVRKTAAKKSSGKSKKVSGKWVIEMRREGEYVAKLYASNGEIILNSETYSTAEGARSGISTIIKGVESGNFVIYNTKGGDYYFKLKSAGNKLLCAGEIYTTKDGCLAAVESVKRFAKTAIISESVEEGAHYVEYIPAKVDYEIKKGARGKWKVERTEDGGYCARLYANNGQLMLSAEEVKERKTALKSIESIKKNSAEGNFVIDKDKFGRFYYKLRNSLKSVICIGEGYDTLEACTSALESVRKFAATAVTPDNAAAAPAAGKTESTEE